VSAPPDDDEPVPRIPRGRGMKLDGAMMARIGMTLVLLIMIIVTAKPCANATSKFVHGFGEEGSASTVMPKPGNVDVLPDKGSAADYESMGANMTDAERRAAFERAKVKAAARAAERAGSAAGSGSAASSGSAAGSGSAGGSGSASGSGSAGGSGGAGGSGSATRP